MKKLQLWYYRIKEFCIEMYKDGDIFLNILFTVMICLLAIMVYTLFLIILSTVGIFNLVLGTVSLIIIIHSIKFLTVYFASKNNEIPKINHSIFKQMNTVAKNNFIYQPYSKYWSEDSFKKIDCYYKNQPIQLTILDFYKVFRQVQKQKLESSLENYIKIKNSRKNKKETNKIKAETATKKLLDEMIQDIQKVKKTLESDT